MLQYVHVEAGKPFVVRTSASQPFAGSNVAPSQSQSEPAMELKTDVITSQKADGNEGHQSNTSVATRKQTRLVYIVRRVIEQV